MTTSQSSGAQTKFDVSVTPANWVTAGICEKKVVNGLRYFVGSFYLYDASTVWDARRHKKFLPVLRRPVTAFESVSDERLLFLDDFESLDAV